jgi:hypothetical protein
VPLARGVRSEEGGVTPRTSAGRALLREFHRSYFSEPHEESECYWTETVLAIEAEAAPAPTIDVERLARALKVHHEQFRKDARLDPCSADCAEPIAAAYEAQP